MTSVDHIESDAYPEAIKLFRNTFTYLLKDNEDVMLSVLTGITRVTKENIFSGLNNLKAFGVLDSELFSHYRFT